MELLLLMPKKIAATTVCMKASLPITWFRWSQDTNMNSDVYPNKLRVACMSPEYYYKKFILPNPICTTTVDPGPTTDGYGIFFYAARMISFSLQLSGTVYDCSYNVLSSKATCSVPTSQVAGYKLLNLGAILLESIQTSRQEWKSDSLFDQTGTGGGGIYKTNTPNTATPILCEPGIMCSGSWTVTQSSEVSLTTSADFSVSLEAGFKSPIGEVTATVAAGGSTSNSVTSSRTLETSIAFSSTDSSVFQCFQLEHKTVKATFKDTYKITPTGALSISYGLSGSTSLYYAPASRLFGKSPLIISVNRVVTVTGYDLSSCA